MCPGFKSQSGGGGVGIAKMSNCLTKKNEALCFRPPPLSVIFYLAFQSEFFWCWIATNSVKCRDVQIICFCMLYVQQCQDSVTGVVTRLRDGWSGVRNLTGLRDFLFPKTVQTGSGAHSAPCSVGTSFIPSGQATRVWSWPLTGHLVPRLRMSGAVPSWCGQEQLYLYTVCSSLYIDSHSYLMTLKVWNITISGCISHGTLLSFTYKHILQHITKLVSCYTCGICLWPTFCWMSGYRLQM